MVGGEYFSAAGNNRLAKQLRAAAHPFATTATSAASTAGSQHSINAHAGNHVDGAVTSPVHNSIALRVVCVKIKRLPSGDHCGGLNLPSEGNVTFISLPSEIRFTTKSVERRNIVRAARQPDQFGLRRDAHGLREYGDRWISDLAKSQ